MKKPSWFNYTGAVAIGVTAFLITVAIATAVVFGFTALVWFVWNTIISPCFNGPHFGFWSTFLILAALRLLVLFIKGK